MKKLEAIIKPFKLEDVIRIRTGEHELDAI